MLEEETNLMDNLCAVEEVAEEILADRQQIVNLDRKRNENREALRALSKQLHRANKETTSTWVCFGNMFLKMDKGTVQDQLSKDQDMLDKEVDNFRNGLKFKLDKLRDLEGKPELQGFHLQPLSNEEMMAVNRRN